MGLWRELEGRGPGDLGLVVGAHRIALRRRGAEARERNAVLRVDGDVTEPDRLRVPSLGVSGR